MDSEDPLFLAPTIGKTAVRVRLNIDDEALARAMELAPGKTASEVVNFALRELVRRRRIRQLLDWRGKLEWSGDLDPLRERSEG